MKRVSISVLLVTFFFANAFSQVNVRDSILSFSAFNSSFAWQVPTGDLAKRFGAFGSVGGSYLRKQKSGLLWGVRGNFLFGGDVKQKDMLSNIMVNDGFVIGADGTLYEVKYLMRGIQFDAFIGKVFPIGGPNKNSGVYTTLGAGLLQHKIRIDTERNADVPPLTKQYVKGYDRLSNGLSINPAIGYLYLGNKRTINFFIQLEYTYAQTFNRRSFNYDTGTNDDTKRNDGALGLRFGWVLPIYKAQAHDFFYF
jgi:hypothetical protein